LHVQDLDGAHWITPFDPAHTPDQAVDFPAEAIDFRKAAGLPAPFSSGLGWTPDGILQGGLHGGPPLFHISCLYELQPVRSGDGGFSCLAGSHLAGARIGPRGEDNVKRGHMPWGKQPWAPEVAKQVTRVEGQPGDCILFTERLVHSTLPWTGSGERRSLFIKYAPYGMHYRDTVYDTALPELSAEEKEVLSFPETGWQTKPFDGIAFTDPENNLLATAKL